MFETWVFDCDGVLLDSNGIKTDAFAAVARPYGRDAAEKFIQYHKDNGGISRFEKFKYLFETILRRKDAAEEINAAIRAYSNLVLEKLVTCPETDGCREFLDSLPPQTRKIVVSGGMETELQEVLGRRGLSNRFQGIFGSPMTKYEILSAERKGGRLPENAILLGDSELDYETATQFGLRFVFFSGYTSMENWSPFCHSRGITVVRNFREFQSEFLAGRIQMAKKK